MLEISPARASSSVETIPLDGQDPRKLNRIQLVESLDLPVYIHQGPLTRLFLKDLKETGEGPEGKWAVTSHESEVFIHGKWQKVKEGIVVRVYTGSSLDRSKWFSCYV